MIDKERWYRLAMNAYPRSYREAREEELVSTLLDASGEARRPEFRELAALITGGLGYRGRSLPEAAAGARLTGAVAVALVVMAALSTVVSSARLGYTAGTVGVAAWVTLAALVVINRGARGPARSATAVAASLVAAAAVVGGAGLMGAHRSFLLPVLALTAIALICPPLDHRLSIGVGVSAAFVGSVAGFWLAARVENRHPVRGHLDQVWAGNPWRLANLDGARTYIAFGALLTIGMVLGLLWPRVAIAVASLAVPLSVTTQIFTANTWGGTPSRADPLGIAAAGLVGLLVAAVMTAVAHLHGRRRASPTSESGRTRLETTAMATPGRKR